VYNGMGVFRFSRDASDNLQCTKLATIGSSPQKVVVGSFEPGGTDNPLPPRIILGTAKIDIPTDQLVFSGKTYNFWISAASPWTDLSDVQIKVRSNDRAIKLVKNSAQIRSIKKGETWSNEKTPFSFAAENVTAPKRFHLTASVVSGSGFRVSKEVSGLFQVFPALTYNSQTLIADDTDTYKDLGFTYDFFPYNSAWEWPPKESLSRHKNLIVLDEYDYSVDRRDKVKEFLDNGGNYLVHGYRVTGGYPDPQDKEEQSFMDSYFKARYKREYTGPSNISGSPNDPISHDFKFELNTKKPWKPGVVDCSAGATPIFFYPNGDVAGVRVEGKYKMVYLEFSLQDIVQIETRKELVRRILAWFDGR
jgi:hypothetical protein